MEDETPILGDQICLSHLDMYCLERRLRHERQKMTDVCNVTKVLEKQSLEMDPMLYAKFISYLRAQHQRLVTMYTRPTNEAGESTTKRY